MGEKAASFARTHFDPDKNQRELERFLEDIAAPGGAIP
jgi:hypothetical protein